VVYRLTKQSIGPPEIVTKMCINALRMPDTDRSQSHYAFMCTHVAHNTLSEHIGYRHNKKGTHSQHIADF